MERRRAAAIQARLHTRCFVSTAYNGNYIHEL